MARNQRDGPMTDEAIEAVRETIRKQRAVVHEDLDAAGVDVSAWSRLDGEEADHHGARDGTDAE